MPGMSGLALFDRLIERGLLGRMPVIFLTGHGDVPTAVAAVKRGAFDFVEKPFSDNALVDRVEQALARSGEVLARLRGLEAVRRKLDELTDRERDVMRLRDRGPAQQADRRRARHQRAHGRSAPRPRVREDGREVGRRTGQSAART